MAHCVSSPPPSVVGSGLQWDNELKRRVAMACKSRSLIGPIYHACVRGERERERLREREMRDEEIKSFDAVGNQLIKDTMPARCCDARYAILQWDKARAGG